MLKSSRRRLFLATLISLGALQAQGQALFRGPQFQVGFNPTVMTVADVNGDGAPDLIAAGKFGSHFTVALNNGSGQYLAPRFVSIPDNPVGVAVGDVNGDGVPDIVTICDRQDNSAFDDDPIAVSLGNGDGTFRVPRTFPIGWSPSAIALGDFDRDNKLDMIAGTFTDIAFLKGNGDGTFQPRVQIIAASPLRFALGDINRDGKLDVLYAPSSVEMGLLLGNGDGTFQALRAIAYGKLSGGLRLADINADNKLDIIAANGNANFPDSSIGVMRGNGDGTFQARQDFAVPSPTAVAVGDLNHDGKPDILTDTAYLFANNAGGFQAAQAYVVQGQALGVEIADSDRDGKNDILYGGRNGIFTALHNQGAGVFPPKFQNNFGGSPKAMTTGHLNQDNAPDFATIEADGTVGVYYTSGILVPTLKRTMSAGDLPEDIALGDLNNDDANDLVTANLNGRSVSVLLNNGDASFQPKRDKALNTDVYALAVGRLNQDSFADVVTANGDNTITAVFSNGDGTLGTPQVYSGFNAPRRVALADMNDDGRLDILVANVAFGNSSVTLLYNDGNGAFSQRLTIPSPRPTPYRLATADLNGDTRLDLIIGYNGGSRIDTLFALPDGTYGGRREYVVGNLVTSITPVEINGDGKLDLVVTSDAENAVTLLLGNGDGTFGQGQGYDVGLTARGVLTNDFDSDGRRDMLVFNGVSNVLFQLPRANNAYLTGRLELEDIAETSPAQRITFVFRPTGAAEITRAIPIDPNGEFTIDHLPAQSGQLRIKGAKYLAIIRAADWAGGAQTGLTGLLRAGDIAEDNTVDLLDLVALFDAYGASDNRPDGPPDLEFNPFADLNGDGVTDLLDLVTLFNNYGESGEDF